MPDWGDPKWQRQGRSGPNGPQYKSRRDRNSVRRTGKPTGKPPKKGGIDCGVVALIGLSVPALGVAALIERML